MGFTIIYSCDEIMKPIGDFEVPDTERVVLLEELTGASCPNCPRGTAEVAAILQEFPGKVAAIGIHGDFLSKPITGRSKYDFRNKKAADLENWFQPWIGKPAATVNRTELNDSNQKYATVITGQWKANVVKELAKPHELSLLLDLKYDDATRIVDIDFTAIPLVNLDGNYNVSIFITESKIIDAQTNSSVIIDEFEHNHVLRDMPTKFDGDAFGTDLKKDTQYKKKYTYTLPKTDDGLWKPENIDVVVAIHHSGGATRNVVQAAYEHLLK